MIILSLDHQIYLVRCWSQGQGGYSFFVVSSGRVVGEDSERDEVRSGIRWHTGSSWNSQSVNWVPPSSHFDLDQMWCKCTGATGMISFA